MLNPRKPVKSGCDYLRDKNWNPRVMTRAGALRFGARNRDATARRFNFEAFICDCGDYFRLSYGRKV